MIINNEFWKEGFDFWQSFASAYTNFVFESTQNTIDQSLIYREQADNMVIDTINKVEALTAKERGVALDLATQFNKQAQTAADQSAEMFKAVSAVMAAPIYSDWGANLAEQLSKAAVVNSK